MKDPVIRLTAELIDEACCEISTLVNIEALALCLGTSPELATAEFQMALAEARQTLSLLENLELPENGSVLEVGAGMGIASTALSFFGFQVTSLEPGGVGFEINKSTSEHISSTVGTRVSLIADSAEKVEFKKGTKFDLIISNNVLEHVQNVEKSLINLLGHLSPSGVMVNSCPNYTFPFEPHFGIPLLPFSPRRTSVFLSSRIRKSGVWKSLNFVTARQVHRIFSGLDFSVHFRKGTMLKSIVRLNADVQFHGRHPVLGRVAANPILISLLNRILSLPYWIATPMDFIVVHKQLAKDERVLEWLNTQ